MVLFLEAIISVPEIFQRKMSVLLKDHEGTVVYMTDVVVEEHYCGLRSVMDTSPQSGIRLSAKLS